MLRITTSSHFPCLLVRNRVCLWNPTWNSQKQRDSILKRLEQRFAILSTLLSCIQKQQDCVISGQCWHLVVMLHLCTQVWLVSVCDLHSQMKVNSFTAHQEIIHGKLSEVMKMLALDILVLRDVSVAVLCQKKRTEAFAEPQQGSLVRLKRTWMTSSSSRWGHRGHTEEPWCPPVFLWEKLSRSRDWAEVCWWTN